MCGYWRPRTATWRKAYSKGPSGGDLYFHLNVLTLRVSPLRECEQEVPLLAVHILERVAHTTGVQRNISDDALKLVLNDDWPGNVRSWRTAWSGRAG